MGRPHQNGKTSAATIPCRPQTTHVSCLIGAARGMSLRRGRRTVDHVPGLGVDLQTVRTVVYSRVYAVDRRLLAGAAYPVQRRPAALGLRLGGDFGAGSSSATTCPSITRPPRPSSSCNSESRKALPAVVDSGRSLASRRSAVFLAISS